MYLSKSLTDVITKEFHKHKMFAAMNLRELSMPHTEFASQKQFYRAVM